MENDTTYTPFFLLKDKHKLYETTYFLKSMSGNACYYISIHFTVKFSVKTLSSKTEPQYLHEFG